MMARSISIFSPLPPMASGISEYTHVLAQALNKIEGNEVTVIVNQKKFSKANSYKVAHWKEFLYKPLPADTILIYQAGNHPMHEYMYPFLFSHPGITVLHDFILGHGRLDALRTANSPDELTQEFRYELGHSQGEHLAGIAKRNISWPNLPYVARLNRSVVTASELVLSHNPDAVLALQDGSPDAIVRYVPMGFLQESSTPRPREECVMAMRRAAGIADTDFVIGSFGAIGPYKQIDILLHAVKQLRCIGLPVKLLVVGFQHSLEFSVARLAQELGVQSAVHVFTNSSSEEYCNWIQAADVCCSLRFPPAGEFSLSSMELMASCKPVIVNQHRFNAYMPESICIKIRSSKMVEDLVDAVRHLHHSPDLRKAIAEQGCDYVQKKHTLHSMIDAYQNVIKSHEPGVRRSKLAELPHHLQPLEQRVWNSIQERLSTFPLPQLQQRWRDAIS